MEQQLSFSELDKFLLQQNGKIIHQVWFGTMPNKKSAKKEYDRLQKYRNSWIQKHPNWLRIEWNKKMCDNLVKNLYSQHYKTYRDYKYDIQRCDAIRYMFLFRYGGLYADMDFFCNITFNKVFEKYTNDIYLVQTPNRVGDYVSNSLMYSKPSHPFWKSVLIALEINKKQPVYYSKHLVIMYTTGPGMLNRVYHENKNQYRVKSWSHKYFQPYGHIDNVMSLSGNSKVYSVHASTGCWHGKDSKMLLLICKEWLIILCIIICMVLPQIAIKKSDL